MRRLWRKRLPFNRKKPLAEPDSGRVAIQLNQLGFDRTEKRGGGHHNTIQRIPVETGKHKLMTTIIQNVYLIWEIKWEKKRAK